MLLTSSCALLAWGVIMVMLLKRGALQPSFLEIAIIAIIYYVIALSGFAIGGFLLAPPPNTARHNL